MSETNSLAGTGALLYDFCGFSELVDVEGEWRKFYQEWTEFTNAHSYGFVTSPSAPDTNANPTPSTNDLLDDDWTGFLAASDSDIVDSPQYPTIFPILPQPETQQTYPPSQVDDGTTFSSWCTTPLIPRSETPPHLPSDARSRQSSSAQNVNYSCNYCPKSYTKRHDLNRHIKLHTKPVACPVNDCSHRTAKRKDMNRHLVAKHPNQHVTQPLLAAPVIKCTVAGCGFIQEGVRRKDNLKRHMRNKHAREGP